MTDIENPPGQPALRRRVRTHPETLARLRALLAEPGNGPGVRGISSQAPAEPTIAVLDAFAVVSDIVAFYSERLADEGYLRTATERRSVRELARTLGVDLRPGVAASAELAFSVETAPGAPVSAVVPAGTPAQSVPGPGELPQTFETSAELLAHVMWNAVPAVSSERQVLEYDSEQLWLAGRIAALQKGDGLLVVGDERRAFPDRTRDADDRESWDFRVVKDVVMDPPGYPGWTLVGLDEPLGYTRRRPLVATENQRVFRLAARGQLFGANAPHPELLVKDEKLPPGAVPGVGGARWADYALVGEIGRSAIELDGDHKGVLADSWIVLQDSGDVEAYRITRVDAGGDERWATSGRFTRLTLDTGVNLDRFSRRSALVHSESIELPAARRPLATILPGIRLTLGPVEPPLERGRPVVVQGCDLEGTLLSFPRTVVSTTGTDDGIDLVLDAPIDETLVASTVVVRANVVPATHGETVRQVLGSGDGRTPFRSFPLRRLPLTHVRAITPTGAAPALDVLVDGIVWRRVDSFAGVGAEDRVYRVVQLENPVDGADEIPTRIVFGDGVTGAIPPTGSENIVASHRVGVGAPGAVAAGAITLLLRRPFGIAAVENPLPTHDWAPPESVADARTTAPLKVRTLDRIVSVPDFADIARGYAGIGQVRADAVWDGRSSNIVVSVCGVDGSDASEDLRSDLADALDLIRDTTRPVLVRHAERNWFAVQVGVHLDPAFPAEATLAAVHDALLSQWGPPARALAQPVAASAVLLTVREVPGVVYCSMPVLRRVPGADTAEDVIPAFGARWDDGIRAAQLLALDPASIEIGALA